MTSAQHDPSSPLVHAMTVDVEDYYHVSALAPAIPREDWSLWPSRVEHSTQRLLELFARHDLRATFFVLGWVADRYPALVRDIAAQGHEVASQIGRASCRERRLM